MINSQFQNLEVKTHPTETSFSIKQTQSTAVPHNKKAPLPIFTDKL